METAPLFILMLLCNSVRTEDLFTSLAAVSEDLWVAMSYDVFSVWMRYSDSQEN